MNKNELYYKSKQNSTNSHDIIKTILTFQLSEQVFMINNLLSHRYY